MEDRSSAEVRAVKKALMQHVVSVMRARLDVVVSAPVKVAGVTEGEQAHNELAGAVSSALQTEAPQDVRATVEAGLQEATTSLQQAGAEQSDLEGALADLSDKLDALFAAVTPPATTANDGVAAAGAHIVTKEKGVLQIRTQEGDVVTVKFANRLDARAGTAQVTVGDREFQSSSLDVTSTSRTKLIVKGDLNAEELGAIQQVVEQVDALANEFFAGNVDAALSHAATLDFDTDQLANVALSLSRKQRVEVAGIRMQDAAPTPAPAPSAEAVTASDHAEQSTDAPAPASEPMPAPAQAAVEQPSADPTAAEPVPQPVQTVANFVARLLATFRSDDGGSTLRLSFHMKLQLLTAAIEAKQPPDESSQPSLSKLQDVAESAAAK